MSDWWSELTPEAREILELGNASYVALKRGETIERWLNVGRAAANLQTEIMSRAGTNVPKGKRYNEVLKRMGVHERLPDLCHIDPTTRSHAVWLANEWDQVNAWLHTLSVNVRLQKNHPTTLRRGYDAYLMQQARSKAAAAKAATEKPAARQDDPLDLVKMLRTGVFKAGTSMREVADLLESGLAYDTLKRLHDEIGKRLDNHERQDRIEASVKKPARKAAPAG
jgi:hypothetical protein